MPGTRIIHWRKNDGKPNRAVSNLGYGTLLLLAEAMFTSFEVKISQHMFS